MKSILKKYWGYDDFRGIQAEIVESISAGRDTLGLMPTGGGKSITFQVPAIAAKGVCIVVTPLISLMKDQVQNLRMRGVKAAAIYSGLSREEIVATLENCIYGEYKLLYVSPERLSSDIFITKMHHMKVSFITVDEAHCISQWGYDFRPSYLAIAEIRKLLPDVAVLALTATATPRVVDDIQERLGFKEKNVHRMSFERKNLTYVVRQVEDKESELIHILQSMQGSAIVYTRSRRLTSEVAKVITEAGITAINYHAGLTNAEKDYRQQKWSSGEYRVMVATNAFGMGIDKPDVRLVVHWDVPDSIEAYFQEAGRAGRDGMAAYAVMLYCKGDSTKLMRRVPDTFPDKEFIRTIYDHICYYFQMAMGDGFEVTREFDLDDFCKRFRHFPVQTDSALKILTRAGYIDYTEEQDTRSRILFTIRRDELYRLHEVGQENEQVIQAVLRCYGGVFSDFVYIEETLIARQTGLTPDAVYKSLIALGRQRILTYIPRKRTPYITFMCRRVEAERIVFAPEVYENRKREYEERIKAIISYAENDEVCRSRQLLDYFGERNESNCLCCDVCLSSSVAGLRKGEYENIHAEIVALLSDGEPHAAGEMRVRGIDSGKVNCTIDFMVRQEELEVVDGMIILRTKQT